MKYKINIVHAQAFYLYKAGFQSWLSDEEFKIQHEINGHFSEELASDVIVDRLELTNDENPENWLAISEIIQQASNRKIIYYAPKENELRECLLKKMKPRQFKTSEKSISRYSAKFK